MPTFGSILNKSFFLFFHCLFFLVQLPLLVFKASVSSLLSKCQLWRHRRDDDDVVNVSKIGCDEYLCYKHCTLYLGDGLQWYCFFAVLACHQRVLIRFDQLMYKQCVVHNLSIIKFYFPRINFGNAGNRSWCVNATAVLCYATPLNKLWESQWSRNFNWKHYFYFKLHQMFPFIRGHHVHLESLKRAISKSSSFYQSLSVEQISASREKSWIRYYNKFRMEFYSTLE